MGSSSHSDGEPDERISALVNDFFERRRTDEHLSPRCFAAEYPEMADELEPYLAGLVLAAKVCVTTGDAGAPETRPALRDLPAIEGYELIEEIGRGGMGVVYQARQVSVKRVVALKVMLAGPFASASARRRFEREAELAGRLQHPGIVRVLESGHAAGQPYYAMDYVAGVRMDDYLTTEELGPHAMLDLFVALCDAVEYAHRQGVIHRDLKPANVLIDEERNPHILDFGLATAIDPVGTEEGAATRVSLTGQVLGTLSYLSPEQALGMPGEIDARTDVYTLGAMLFEALTGSLPLDASGRPPNAIRNILETPPTRPSSLSAQVDGELETIVLKALEKEKPHRYQSTKEMADDLRRYLAGEPILARRPSSLYVLRKKLRKHRVWVGLAAAVVVVALAVGLLELRAEQRRVAATRRAAVELQWTLEAGGDVRGDLATFTRQYPELPELQLLDAHAEYRSKAPGMGAIPRLEAILRRDPSCWAQRALLAEMYDLVGDGERAAAMRVQAEREAPDTAEAWYLRSFATLDAQRALRCVEEVLQRQPAHALALQRRAYLHVQTGDLDGALDDAERLVELGEDRNEWITFQSSVLAREGRYREALEVLAQAQAYAERAHAHRLLGEYEKAIEYYTRMIDDAGEATASGWHFFQRATPLWILGRADEAEADCRRAHIAIGRLSYADARRYLILRDLGRRPDAEEALAAALRDAEKPSWLRQIFRCLAGELRPDELVAEGVARNNLEQLCEACYYAGEVCRLANQPAEARKWFEQSVQTGVAYDPDAQLGTPMNEYELAEWRLRQMANDD